MSIIRIFRFIYKHPLNNGMKFKAFYRFLSWQLGQRILKKPVIIDYVNGTRLIAKKSMEAATSTLYCGLQEYVEMSFLLHFLREDDLFVDVGANIGTYTVLAGAAIGAQCFSFEPIPDTYEALLDNIYLNRMTHKVTAYNFGISDHTGVKLFTKDLGTCNHMLTGDTGGHRNVIEIPVKKLDDILEGKNPIALKIDVEGFEESVVDGAAETLRNNSLLIVIAETFGGSKLDKIMSAYGFGRYTYLPFERALAPYHDTAGNNTIYARSLERVTERIQSSQQFKVLNKLI